MIVALLAGPGQVLKVLWIHRGNTLMVNCHFGEFIVLYLSPTIMTLLFVKGPYDY